MMKPTMLLLSLVGLLTACGGSDKPATEAPKTPAPAASTPAASSTTTPTTSAQPSANTATTPATLQPSANNVTAGSNQAELTAQAKEAVQKFGGTLKGELETAIQSGGPIVALSICNLKAPEIAKNVSATAGMDISRVSLKNRNPTQGVPNAWQTQVLTDFEARKAKGEAVDTLVFTEIKDGEYHFMKAIPTGQMCLTCHGTAIAPDVSAKIKELYPNDKATGYQEGEIRGAFVAVRKL